MADTTDPHRTYPADLSLIELLSGMLRSWRLVLLLPVLFSVLLASRRLMLPAAYSATGTFVSQSAETRGLGAATALAQQFGVDLGADRSAQSPQFYEGLLRSNTILRRAVESPYPRSDSARRAPGTLIDRWHLKRDANPLPPWRRGVARLRGAISTSVKRETGVIELTVTLDDPDIAQNVAVRLLDLLNEYNLQVRQAQARTEELFSGGRLADARRDLRAAEAALETFLRSNRDFRNSPELTFQYDRLQRELMTRQEVVGALMRTQEQARIEALRTAPVLQVIDSPAGMATRAPRKAALHGVIGLLLGVLLAVGIAGARTVARRSRLAQDPVFVEFTSVARQTWSDIRRPSRWVGRRPSTGR
ncbi:MAG: GumC domain-containing protein [Gemmatimonadaceae bacterium]